MSHRTISWFGFVAPAGQSLGIPHIAGFNVGIFRDVNRRDRHQVTRRVYDLFSVSGRFEIAQSAMMRWATNSGHHKGQ
jgi:hypothetical protein